MGRARVGRILRARGLFRGVTFNAGGVVVVFGQPLLLLLSSLLLLLLRNLV